MDRVIAYNVIGTGFDPSNIQVLLLLLFIGMRCEVVGRQMKPEVINGIF